MENFRIRFLTIKQPNFWTLNTVPPSFRKFRISFYLKLGRIVLLAIIHAQE